MNANNTYLAVFLGSKTSPRRVAWDALSEGDRRAKEREGMAAWKAWAEKHHAAIVSMGGPLGKNQESHATWNRRCEQRHGRFHGCARGFARGRRQAIR